MHLFHNKPYNVSDDCCTTLELTNGKRTYTFDEVVVRSYVAIAIDTPAGGAEDVFLTAYHLWD